MASARQPAHQQPSIASTDANSDKTYSDAAIDSATNNNDSSEQSSWSIAISSSTVSPTVVAADSIGRFDCCRSRCLVSARQPDELCAPDSWIGANRGWQSLFVLFVAFG